MAFHYPLTVPSEIGAAKLIRWQLAERDRIETGTAIADFIGNAGHYVALANGIGRLWIQVAPEGSLLSAGDEFASIAAEGEDIPYGKPYVVFKLLNMSP